jgi:hypothetical protein
LQGLTTSLAELRIVWIVGLAIQALHQHYTPTELQSMTARHECQAPRLRVIPTQ